MRKAISRKASRRKQSSDTANKGSLSPSNSGQNDAIHEQQQKRKSTEGEAVLTAKNYRLAKELSELRVRHREESKNVTRLTMENMNLASRCREAISHVAMLKKELAMHQRRAAEALALQRQQHAQKLRSDNVTTFSELGQSMEQMTAEMERMDRLMAAHAPPGPPPGPPPLTVKPAKDTISLKSSGSNGSPTSEFYADYKDEKKAASPTAGSTLDVSAALTQSDVSFSPKAIFPLSASPRASFKTKKYNEGFPDDLPLSSKKKLSKLIRSTPPEIMEIEHDASSSEFESGIGMEKRKKMISSIDAFEASFATTFPVFFDSTTDNQSSEIYNPFFPSPSRKKMEKEKESLNSFEPTITEKNFINKSDDSLDQNQAESIRKYTNGLLELKKNLPTASNEELLPELNKITCASSPEIKAKFSTSTRSYQHASSNNRSAVDISPSNFHASIRDVTPPSIQRILITSIQDQSDPRTPDSRASRNTENTLEHPRRPEKTMSVAARARYEKALQPRNNISNRSTTVRGPQSPEEEKQKQSIVQVDQESNFVLDINEEKKRNSNPVLKRLQQKRNDEKLIEDNLVASDNSSFRGNSGSKVTLNLAQNHVEASISPSKPTVNTSPFLKTKPAITITDSSSPIKVNGQETQIETGTAASPSVSSAISAYEEAVARNRVEDTSSRASKSSSRPVACLGPSDEEDSRTKEEKIIAGTGTSDFQSRTRSLSDSFERNDQVETPQGQECSDMSFAKFSTTGRSTRRNIKQPMSYAEPSVHSKLRRGDVYFAKEEQSDKNQNNSEIRKDYTSSVVRL
mmetsp:Transcript_36063/g.41153  ORF Transcript_36063/g.41153 Transcript_36063/m.41153 type:complete len:802 (-) Transcript_36063:649-3054(-)